MATFYYLRWPLALIVIGLILKNISSVTKSDNLVVLGFLLETIGLFLLLIKIAMTTKPKT